MMSSVRNPSPSTRTRSSSGSMRFKDGKERELKDLLSGKAPQRLVIAVQDRAPQMFADPNLDGDVHAAAERIAVGSDEEAGYREAPP